MCSEAQSRLWLLQLRETQSILHDISAAAVAALQSALRGAGQVCCYGPGREGLVLKAFATRLHQIGIKVTQPMIQPVCSADHFCALLQLWHKTSSGVV